MAKTKTTFFCQNCGTQSAKWQGQCTSCKQWNTIAEEVIQKAEKASWDISQTNTFPSHRIEYKYNHIKTFSQQQFSYDITIYQPKTPSITVTIPPKPLHYLKK